jgi:hypothetical protein
MWFTLSEEQLPIEKREVKFVEDGIRDRPLALGRVKLGKSSVYPFTIQSKLPIPVCNVISEPTANFESISISQNLSSEYFSQRLEECPRDLHLLLCPPHELNYMM